MKKSYLLFSIVFLLLNSCDKSDFIEEVANSEEDVIAAKSTASNKSFMVVSKSETLSKELLSSVKKYGEIIRTIPEIGILVVKPSNANFENEVANLDDVKSVIPDLTVDWIEPVDVDPFANPISIGSDEPYFFYQWGMDAIDAPEAWNVGYQGENAKVFILDSGIDAEHPDLASNLNTELSASFVEGEDWNIQPGFYFNHGTHVAGIIAAADNSFGVIGVAPKSEIVAVKVLSEFTGSGPFSGINAGIVYAANNGADVINMSLGTTLNKDGKFYDEEGNLTAKIPSKYIQEIIYAQQRAIDYAFKKGVTIITSAGNSGMNGDGNGSTIVLPADLNNVISVSATAPLNWALDTSTNLDELASYSNYGNSLVDLAAPGGDFDSPYSFYYYDMVLSTISNGWSWSAGTSMASPHVAGVAALIIGKNGGEMNPHEVEKKLFETADKIDKNNSAYYGYGRVNAFKAVTE
ncbi:S8 family serine peptidase [Lutibacter sp. B1]|uniref:S8 family peptidase n=1 Tax=Lutibacter sp. B1 TaxID=2725996 RepID=UPI00145682CD|nr:S8 family serine peptidase [Lutibacter sp. B1]NLP57870.1 S8 family serine peptidase [Lutibacter sp. B1]